MIYHEINVFVKVITIRHSFTICCHSLASKMSSFSFVHFHDPKFRIIRGASCSYMEIEKRKQKRTRRQRCSRVEVEDENRGYGYADDLGRSKKRIVPNQISEVAGRPSSVENNDQLARFLTPLQIYSLQAHLPPLQLH